MIKIYLDDMRIPTDTDWTVVTNYLDFIKKLESINEKRAKDIIE